MPGRRRSTCTDGTTAGDTLSDCSTASGDESSDSDLELLVLFDWDDTLFPTTWIRQQGLATTVPDAAQQAELRRLAASTASTLQMAVDVAHVVIVTNAHRGWVEQTCKKYMPALVPYLDAVDIVSARSAYEQRCGYNPTAWKHLAFERAAERVYGPASAGGRRHIVSLGDSIYEQEALARVVECATNCWGKSFKFMEAPSIEQLREQHELLRERFLDVVRHNGDIAVEIDIAWRALD